MDITKENICKKLKTYDFENNSIKSFADSFGISSKTVKRYLKECNIRVNKRNIIQSHKRDYTGKFCLKRNDTKLNFNLNKTKKTSCKANKNYKELTIKEKEDLVDELFTF